MYLTEKELGEIRSLAQSMGIRSVYVFGSALKDEGEPADIDIAIKGVPRGVLFKFDAKLSRLFSKPVDLVDLDVRNPVTDLIARDAVKIHG